jgi:integrase
MTIIWRADRGTFCLKIGRSIKSLGTADRAEAESKAKEIESASLDKIFDKYIRKLVAAKSPSEWRVNIVHRHFVRILPTASADQLTDAHVETYTKQRLSEGVLPQTVADELGYLKTALKHSGFGCPAFERPKKRKRKTFLKMEEIKTVFDAAEGWVKTFLLLALHTGGRRAAILELTWDRVDFDAGTIDLRNPVLEGRRKGRAVVKMSKTIREHLKALKPENAGGSPVLVKLDGSAVKYVKREMAALRKLVGVEKMTPHVIRHSIARHMIANKIPMKEVSVFLGHESVKTTEEIYAIFEPDFMKESADFLDTIGGPNEA